MKSALYLASIAALIAGTAAADPFIERRGQDGNTVAEWDVKMGKLPPFVFAGTDITPGDAKFYCHKSSGAVWARINGTVYALNKPASNPDLRIGEDGKAFDAVSTFDPGNKATSNADVSTRIAAQAERLCNPAPMVVRDPGAEKPIDFAMSLCSIIDRLETTTSPCSVSAASQRVIATLNVTPATGKDACREIRSFVAERKWNLRGWQLHIASPYSGEKSVAFCGL